MHVRGRITMPSRPNALGVTGPVPGVVVYAKAHNSRVRHEFARFCTLNGLDARLVHEGVEPGVNAYEVVGGVADLRKLIRHATVARWHYVMGVRPPRACGPARDRLSGVVQSPAGSIPSNVPDRVRRAILCSRLPRADREAVAETERRSRLPQAERLAIELDEAQQLPH